MLGAIRRVGALVLAATAVAVHGLPAAAAAPDALGVLAVAPPPGPGAELLDMTGRLRQRIAERSPGTLDATQLGQRIAVPDPSAALPGLEGSYEEARLAYLDGDFARSVETLRQAADALERLPDGADVHALWRKVVLRLARTELDLGRPEAARAALERLLRGVPDLAVDPSLVPARLVEEIGKARAALQAMPAGTLAVTSSAPGSRVYVNGREVGAAPVRLDLPRGRYRVSGRTETSRVGPVAADVGGEPREVLLDFAVPEALRLCSGQCLAVPAEERLHLLVEAGGHLGLDRIVAVAMVEEAGDTYVLASLYDVRRRLLEREARLRLARGAIPAGGDAALAEFIVSGRTESPLVQVPGSPRPPPPDLGAAPVEKDRLAIRAPGDASSPVAKQAVRWSPVAAAAASVAFTTLAVLQLRSAEDSYDRARRFRASVGLTDASGVTTYNGYVADGDAAKGRAALYWTGAGLSAAASAILGYLSYRRTGAFGPVQF